MSKSKLRKEYENVMGTVDCTLQLFNAEGKMVYYESTIGFWVKTEYNAAGQVVYSENSEGLWSKYEYDEEGTQVYRAHSNGKIIDNRPPKAKIFTDEKGTKYKVVEVTQ